MSRHRIACGSASSALLGDQLRFDGEQPGDDNRWVMRSWPEALERAHYADPTVQAVESPGTRRQQASPCGERWVVRGENSDIAHVRSFVDAVKSRIQPLEDAASVTAPRRWRIW